MIDPSPACTRALTSVVSALRTLGHEVLDINPPSPYRALQIASILLNADGLQTLRSFYRTGETDDPGMEQLDAYMRFPRPLKYLYYLWVKYVRRDSIWAGLLKSFHARSARRQWELVARREAYRAEWHTWWQEEGQVDFLVTPPHASPALPHGAMKDAVSSCGYTFLFNLVSLTAILIYHYFHLRLSLRLCLDLLTSGSLTTPVAFFL